MHSAKQNQFNYINTYIKKFNESVIMQIKYVKEVDSVVKHIIK